MLFRVLTNNLYWATISYGSAIEQPPLLVYCHVRRHDSDGIPAIVNATQWGIRRKPHGEGKSH